MTILIDRDDLAGSYLQKSAPGFGGGGGNNVVESIARLEVAKWRDELQRDLRTYRTVHQARTEQRSHLRDCAVGGN